MWKAEVILPMVHVYPLDDLIEHFVEDPESCQCQPMIRNGVVIHHSLDGREFSEWDYTGLAMPEER